MSCSWSTVLNPLNMMRAMWDFTVYCWRRLEVFCSRVAITEQAPTVERVVAFEMQPVERRDNLRRQYSVKARRGSFSSSMEDSTLSGPSAPPDTFSVPETISQASDTSVPTSDDQQSERMLRNPRSGQVQQSTPLLQRRETQRSQERSSASFEGVSDSSEKSYKTF